ncbi:MAG: hypothetical protein AAFQ91_34630, partial [Cyanobacteria bacterium J06621_15]
LCVLRALCGFFNKRSRPRKMLGYSSRKLRLHSVQPNLQISTPSSPSPPSRFAILRSIGYN